MSDANWKKLTNAQVIQTAEDLTARDIADNDAKDAIKFVRWLEPILEESSQFALEEPELAERYHTFLNKCKLVALTLLSWDEIEDFLENSFTTIFQMPDYFDFWDRIRTKLLVVPEYEERDNIKKRLREALLRSKEILSGDYLVGDDNKKLSATVGNWLHDYVTAVGIAPAEAVRRSEYLTKNKNVQHLGPKEREKLEQLIAIFEQLKLSSLTPLGLEETVVTEVNDRPVVLKQGIFEPIDPKVSEIIRKMRQAGIFPAVQEEEKKKITQEYQAKAEKAGEIKQEWGENVVKVKDFLASSFLATGAGGAVRVEKEEGLAALSFLAQKNALATLLNDDLRFKKDFVEFVKKQNLSDELQRLSISPTSPLIVASFLRYFLEKKLNISPVDSPRHAVRLGNLMKQAGKPEYFDMAYYDMKEKKFKWKM